ncbi:radical SAM protein [Ectothiorhodospira variabilis]|uniref:radical SAM protein n=1 Tax=Ectothiorhodospira variabilis TaxID=505694 RepID=UPI001EFA8C33|nr:radical SAM protein [Ectothiorhodospira variabilis]MCG5496602.1 radical SAM protein [Ectothiorhodospira variabilis]
MSLISDTSSSPWEDLVRRVEPLEDIPLDADLVQTLEAENEPRFRGRGHPVDLYTPTFKSFQTSEISSCGKNAWPAVSITGPDCKLRCDHCKAKLLEPMIPARTPEALWRVVNDIVEQGGQGMLLTGGSNHRNEVEYGPFYDTIRRIKDSFPGFRIALHTALVDDDAARCMEQAGIDAAMMDVIGAQETITQVYHLKRTVADFEATLEALVNTRMKVVPHIVMGLHYGHFLGEWEALKMIQRHRPDAVVLVVVMPFYAPDSKPFVTPRAVDVGHFFHDARRALRDLPLLLGCARPAGQVKGEMDAYAVMAGIDGLAHPADGVVELSARLGRRVRVIPSCCSMAVGEEVMALNDGQAALEVDLKAIVADERARRRQRSASGMGPGGIPVVMEQGASGP